MFKTSDKVSVIFSVMLQTRAFSGLLRVKVCFVPCTGHCWYNVTLRIYRANS